MPGVLPKNLLFGKTLRYTQLGMASILSLIAQGLSNAAIARQLGLSNKTVSNYVSNIFNKLQVADRAQAMLRARQAGLG